VWPTRLLRSIGPVITTPDPSSQQVGAFLGTGFATDGGRVLTAGHVLRRFGLGPGFVPAITLFEEEPWRSVELKNIKVSLDFDLAVAELAEPDAMEPLAIASTDPAANVDVFTYEFSGSEVERRPEGDVRVFSPLLRKGNVLRFFTETTFVVKGPATMLEVSFPALVGASGAPIMAIPTGDVIGLIVRNVERELMPAQTLIEEDPNTGKRETRLFFLPNGQAISWEHIAAFLEETADR
jgi:hypothetical protein